MNRILHKKPFFAAALSILVGLISIFLGNEIVMKGNANGAVLYLPGILFVLTGIITVLVYSALNSKIRRILREPLLEYEIPISVMNETIRDQIKEIKSKSRGTTGLLLFFCAVAMLLSPLLSDQPFIMVLTVLAVAVLLTVSSFFITRFRARRLTGGVLFIVLAKEGACLNGELHSWRFPNYLGNAELVTRNQVNSIEITYYSLSATGTQTHTVQLPVLPDQYARVQEILPVLRSKIKNID